MAKPQPGGVGRIAVVHLVRSRVAIGPPPLNRPAAGPAPYRVARYCLDSVALPRLRRLQRRIAAPSGPDLAVVRTSSRPLAGSLVRDSYGVGPEDVLIP